MNDLDDEAVDAALERLATDPVMLAAYRAEALAWAELDVAVED